MGSKISINFKFSPNASKEFKNKLSKDIINATEGSSDLRKQIRKVFQQANRRIQNVEKSGNFSPAVAALGKGDIKGYSKFSVKGFGNTGDSWKELKKEYAKAVSFLNQPTSTAKGAKQFETQVKEQMNVDEKLWEEIRDSILKNYNSVSSSLLLSLPYSDFMQEVYSRAAGSSSIQMERDAKIAERDIQEKINRLADKLATGANEALEAMISGFKIDF